MTAPSPSLDDPGSRLLRLLAGSARGPKRDGTYALWLTVRVTLDLGAEPPPADRAHRRRVALLEKRMSSLTMSTPLRRALQAAVAQLREVRPETPQLVLSQLVAPTRDTLGAPAADCVQEAARAVQRR